MHVKDLAIKRLNAFLAETVRLQECEFPYPNAAEALDSIRQAFTNVRDQVEQLDAQTDPVVVSQACALALHDIVVYLPWLGFILRSTNVRNAFELYKPLLRLAGDVLEPTIPKELRNTRLLISSEWDYSPFIVTELPYLPNFVLIGLPAHESSNPLLLPVSGHELGHRAWAKNRFIARYKPLITGEVIKELTKRWAEFQLHFNMQGVPSTQMTNNVFVYSHIDTAVQYAIKQAEECFCDFAGTRVFGTAYLRAFAYLCAPNFAGVRHPYYPNMHVRAENLVFAAQAYGITYPSDYNNLFEDLPDPPIQPADLFLLSVADVALQAVVPNLVSEADNVLRAAHYAIPSNQQAEEIYKRFQKVIPAENANCVADILNAGWLAYEDPNLWRDIPRISQHKDDVLKELILKSIEVFEIEQLQQEAVP